MILKDTLSSISVLSLFAFSISHVQCMDSPQFFAQQAGNSKYLEAFKAVEDGNYEKLEDILLDDETAIKAIDKRQNSLLHVTLQKRNDKIVELLINEQADINAVNRFGNTPLHEAVSSGSFAMIERLLREGANVNAQNKKLETPLHLAVIKQDIDCIVRLMNAKSFDPTLANSHGETASDIVASQVRSTYENVEKATEIQGKLGLYSNINVLKILKDEVILTKNIQDLAKMTAQQDKKIFFSYCWHREHGTKPMVDDFENLLKKLNIINYYRDIREEESHGMTLGTHIETFMKNAKTADVVVIFLNEAYLRSRNCMYEFLQVWDSANRSLSKKAFVIRHPECNIFGGPSTHTIYTNHWEFVKEKINEDAKNIKEAARLEWHAKEARFVEEIMRDMSYIIHYLASHIQSDYHQQRQKCFEDIFKVLLGNHITSQINGDQSKDQMTLSLTNINSQLSIQSKELPNEEIKIQDNKKELRSAQFDTEEPTVSLDPEPNDIKEIDNKEKQENLKLWHSSIDIISSNYIDMYRNTITFEEVLENYEALLPFIKNVHPVSSSILTELTYEEIRDAQRLIKAIQEDVVHNIEFMTNYLKRPGMASHRRMLWTDVRRYNEDPIKERGGALGRIIVDRENPNKKTWHIRYPLPNLKKLLMIEMDFYKRITGEAHIRDDQSKKQDDVKSDLSKGSVEEKLILAKGGLPMQEYLKMQDAIRKVQGGNY